MRVFRRCSQDVPLLRRWRTSAPGLGSTAGSSRSPIGQRTRSRGAWAGKPEEVRVSTLASASLAEARGNELLHDSLRQGPIDGEVQRAFGHRVAS